MGYANLHVFTLDYSVALRAIPIGLDQLCWGIYFDGVYANVFTLDYTVSRLIRLSASMYMHLVICI